MLFIFQLTSLGRLPKPGACGFVRFPRPAIGDAGGCARYLRPDGIANANCNGRSTHTTDAAGKVWTNCADGLVAWRV